MQRHTFGRHIVNKSQSLFVFCILATLNLSAVRKVNIVNQATAPVRVDLTIPGRTEAQIQLKAIQQVRQLNPNAQALLLKAIANDSKEEIMRAIRIGADVNYVQGGMSPLLMAILLKKDKALQFLMEQGAQPNKTMFDYAIEQGRNIKSAYLLAKRMGFDVNAKYRIWSQDITLLQFALSQDKIDFELAAILMKDGAYCDHDIMKHIRFYSEHDIKHLIQLMQGLLNCGCDLNSALTNNNIYFNEEALKWVLQNGGNPNHVFVENISNSGTFRTPLFTAIEQGASLSIIEILLNAGADVNQKAKLYPSDKIQTPLAFAISQNRQDIVEFLIIRGATLE